MHFTIMDQLAFVTRGSDETDASVVSYPSNPRKSPETSAFGMRLKDGVDNLWRDSTTIVEGIKGLREGPEAVRAAVALAPFTSFAMFMGLGMTT